MRTLESVLTAALAAGVACVAVGTGVALGVGFLLVAFYLYLLPYMSAPAAAAATGGLAFVVAIIVVGTFALAIRVARARTAYRAAEHTRPSREAGESAASGPSAIVREAGGWIGEHPMAAGLGALSAGLVLGLNPELRRALADGISAWLRASRPKGEEASDRRYG